MVSVIFFWEIRQELSEPYKSTVTKVITCKEAVGAFFIHLRHASKISLKSRHLFDQTSLKFVVCWIVLDYFFFW